MVADAEFQRLYVPITIAADGRLFPTLLWARIDSRAIGVELSAGSFHLPGLFFSTSPHRAVLSTGRLVTRIPPQESVQFTRLPDEIRNWRSRAIASHPVDLTFDGNTVTVTAGAEGSELAEVVFDKPTS